MEVVKDYIVQWIALNMSYPVLSHIIFDPLDERWASTYQAILPPPFFIVRRFAKSTEKQFRTVPMYGTLA